jgi:hypothetical protein
LHANSRVEEQVCWLVNEAFLCVLNCAHKNCIEGKY